MGCCVNMELRSLFQEIEIKENSPQTINLNFQANDSLGLIEIAG